MRTDSSIKRYLKDCHAIRFDGNGYSDEWKEEAQKRGLDCETSAPIVIDNYLTDSSVNMFKTTGVLTKAELLSRCEVKWENYTLKIQIESRVLGDLVINHVLPAAKRYQTMLLQNVLSVKQIFPEDEVSKLNEQDYIIIRRIEKHVAAIIEEVEQMKNARKQANHIDNQRDKAIAYHDNVVPLMEQIREAIEQDRLLDFREELKAKGTFD